MMVRAKKHKRPPFGGRLRYGFQDGYSKESFVPVLFKFSGN